MRQPTAALAVAIICVLIPGCGSTIGNAESTTTTRSMIPRPLVERELAGLLLSPEQVNVAMATAGMTVTNSQTAMSDNSATMAPQVPRHRRRGGGPGLCQQRLPGRARSEPQRRR